MITSRFKIDVTEPFETLTNAPIVEAVIQFNSPPSATFQQTGLKEVLTSEFMDYKIDERCSMRRASKVRLTEKLRSIIDPNGTVIVSNPKTASMFANGRVTGSYSAGYSRTRLGLGC